MTSPRRNTNLEYGCQNKKQYSSMGDVKLAVRRLRKNGERAAYYRCSLCGYIHLGHM